MSPRIRLLYGSAWNMHKSSYNKFISGKNVVVRGTAISTPVIVPRSEHNISRAGISENALKVLYRLKDAGYGAYLVGGCVRDMLLGREPKDFDVATDARPDEINKLFRNCRLIGRRFRLAHIHFGREFIEVATFRGRGADDEEARVIEDGRIIRDNVYGSIEEDAWRRDFTINALYYNIDGFTVVDYIGGMQDLRAGLLRLIDDPETRYQEDPVRMLRAVRFSAKLGLRIHPESAAPIMELAHLLDGIPVSRLYEEVLKLFLGGVAEPTFEMLRHYGLFEHLFPATERSLSEQREGVALNLVLRALANTDARINQAKPVTPAFLYAALLWAPMIEAASRLQEEGLPEMLALQQASRDVLHGQSRHAALPRRFGTQTREIWMLQPRLRRNAGKRALRLLEHPRFRAAYDFLLLRAEAGEDIEDLCDWWTRLQESDQTERQAMSHERRRAGKRPRRRRKAKSKA